LAILKEPNSTILKYRSKLGISTPKNIIKTDPIHNNLASKLNISLSNQKDLLYGIRASYHDMYDIDYDFNLGEYITFFDIQMINNRLDSATFLKIDSLAPIDDLYQPISWGLEFGYKEHKLYANGRGGVSYLAFNSLLFLEPTIQISNSIDIGYQIGILKTIDRIKFGVIAKKPKNIDSFITYQFDKNMAINLHINRKTYKFGLFYYF